MVQPRRAVGRHPQPGLPRRNLVRDDRPRNRRGAAPGPRLAGRDRATSGTRRKLHPRCCEAMGRWQPRKRLAEGRLHRLRRPPPRAKLGEDFNYRIITVTARRFCAQASSLEPVATGRSLPQLVTTRRAVGHALRHQEIARRIGAPLTQRLVIFARAALVGMALDRGADIGIGDQPARLRRQRGLRRLVERIFVGPEIDGVGTRLGDQVGLQRRQLDHFQAVGSVELGSASAAPAPPASLPRAAACAWRRRRATARWRSCR